MTNASTALATRQTVVHEATTAPIEAYEAALVDGDLKGLSSERRIAYYRAVCASLGLNPLTKPFEYITLNGKLTLYAKRDAADQLRAINGVRITITAREQAGDVWIVTARAEMPDGRGDESIGAVNIQGLKGEALANALMKAETKAKRRVTLSICGLGWLDETEVETIPSARSEHDKPVYSRTVYPSMGTPGDWPETETIVDSVPHEDAEDTGERYQGETVWDVDGVRCVARTKANGGHYLQTLDPCPVHNAPYFLAPDGDTRAWAHGKGDEKCLRSQALAEPAEGEFTETEVEPESEPMQVDEPVPSPVVTKAQLESLVEAAGGYGLDLEETTRRVRDRFGVEPADLTLNQARAFITALKKPATARG